MSKKITIIRERFLARDGDKNTLVTQVDCELSSDGELKLTWNTQQNETAFWINVIENYFFNNIEMKLNSYWGKII